jgi:hypothetical protein
MLCAAIIGTVAVAIAGFIAVRLIGGGQIGGGSPLAEAGDGLDGQSVRMRLEDDINLSGNDHRRSTSDVVTVPDGSRGRVTLTVDSPRLDTLPQEHVFIGHEVWWRSERIASDLPPGKEWVHATEPIPLVMFTPVDYAHMLRLADDVREVDDDSATTHYEGVVDIATFTTEAGGASEMRFRDIFSRRATRFPIDAWIDDDGTPTRVDVTIRTATGGRYDLRTDFVEIGVRVDAEPPPADTVIEQDAYFAIRSG